MRTRGHEDTRTRHLSSVKKSKVVYPNTFVVRIPKNHLEDIQSREMLLHVYKPIISGFTALCALEFFIGEHLHAYKGMSTSFHHTYAMVIFVYDNVSIIYRFTGLYYDQH